MIKFSIITPNYNSGKLLKICTKSIYVQSGLGKLFELEHIIIDGHSNDGSLNFLTAEFSNSQVIFQHRRGVFSAMNLGLSLATGEIIAFLNADDCYIDPAVLISVLNKLSLDNVALVYGDLIIVNRLKTYKVQRVWTTGNFSIDQLRRGWMPPHPSLFAKRKVFDSVGNFNENFRISGDYDWIIRAFSKFKNNVYYLPMKLVMMRSGGISNNGNLNMLLKKNFEDLIIIKQNKIGGFITLILKKLRKLTQIKWIGNYHE